MNLSKAVTDHAPQALQDIDQRIARLLTELRELQTRRVNIALHLSVEELGYPSLPLLLDTALEDDE